MNILICDDYPDDSQRLAATIQKLFPSFKIVIYENAYEVIEHFHFGKSVDICFLDILMPEVTGVALAKKIRDNNFHTEIVFLTSSNDFAVQSYDVDAFSYLLKPATEDSIRRILDKYDKKKKKEDSGKILLKTQSHTRYVKFHDISYVEVLNHNVIFYLTNGESLKIYATFSSIVSELLEDDRFVRCHRSFLVNMEYVAAISDKNITMNGGKEIPISKSYSDTRSHYLKWLFGGKANES